VNPNFSTWKTFAENCGLDELVHLILTDRNAVSAEPDEAVWAIVDSLSEGANVLDFGCGVCRNSIAYAMRRPDIQFVGYDSAEMVGRVTEYCRFRFSAELPANLTLLSNWESVCSRRYDVAYATLVFQHVPHDDIRMYVSGLKQCAGRLAIYGRRYSDYGGSTWSALESCGLTPANAASVGYAADGDPHEHLPVCIYELQPGSEK
jgi:SAM-dependent methyltransferase